MVASHAYVQVKDHAGKSLLGTNILAYLGLAFNEKGKENVIEFWPVVNVIKLFFFVTDKSK